MAHIAVGEADGAGFLDETTGHNTSCTTAGATCYLIAISRTGLAPTQSIFISTLVDGRACTRKGGIS